MLGLMYGEYNCYLVYKLCISILVASQLPLVPVDSNILNKQHSSMLATTMIINTDFHIIKGICHLGVFISFPPLLIH